MASTISKLSRLSLFLCFALFGTYTSAFAKATFGGEFTFTNAAIQQAQTEPYIVDNDEAVKHQIAMVQAALKSCDGCRMIEKENDYGVKIYKILYPDGFYFVVATDPGCVEVQTQPLTNANIKKNIQRLNRDLFGAAASVNIKPSPRIGGGHIHFGWFSATKGDLIMNRNILVDFANHPELAQGVFGMSVANAPPLNALPADRQQAFKDIIQAVDTGKIRSVNTLMKRVQKEVYNFQVNGWDPPEKYHDLNITRIVKNAFTQAMKTFEMRFLLAQNNAEEYEWQTRLFDGRLEYLRKLDGRLALDIPGNLSTAERYDRFSRYVAESGVDFEVFRQKVALYDMAAAKAAKVYTKKDCRFYFNALAAGAH